MTSSNKAFYPDPFFKDLPQADCEYLKSVSTYMECGKKMTLFNQGQQATFVYILIKGWVKLYNISAEGKENGFLIMTKKGLCGIESIFDGGHYRFSAEWVSSGRCLQMPANLLRQKAVESAALSTVILNAMSHQIENIQIEKACSSLGTAPQRVACLILRLSSWMTGDGGTFRLPYDKACAAIQLGMDQATFSRSIAKLEDAGVSSSNSEVTVQSFQKLSQHCCPSCSIPREQCLGRRLEEIVKIDLKRNRRNH